MAYNQSINDIGIFNVAKIAGVITKSTEGKSICGQLQMSGNDCLNRYVFSLWQKSVKEEDD